MSVRLSAYRAILVAAAVLLLGWPAAAQRWDGSAPVYQRHALQPPPAGGASGYGGPSRWSGQPPQYGYGQPSPYGQGRPPQHGQGRPPYGHGQQPYGHGKPQPNMAAPAAGATSSGWFQRPYPYHLDYYRMRYGGSYAPYFGNLYGPPNVYLTPPYYGGYGYGAYGYGAYGGNVAAGYPYGDGPLVAPAAPAAVAPDGQRVPEAAAVPSTESPTP